MEPILHFTKENRWLSNFWPCVVEYKGKKYPSSEHAYMAQKTTDAALAEQIRLAQTSREAKALGRKVELREGWEEMKYQVMLDVVRCKFQQNEDIREKLLATGDAHLEEGNWWNDTYWGVCRGKGENNLGKILMLVRQELRVWKECNESLVSAGCDPVISNMVARVASTRPLDL